MKLNVSNALYEQCLQSLQKLLQIPSVKEPPAQNAPFGKPIGMALDYFLQEAESLQLKTRNMDGYIGIVEMGEGIEELGILVHLDVVPEGDLSEWSVDPFAATIKDDRIWGRGTLDNKGPAMAVLYAMKMVQDLSLPWKRRIRLIIGTDEERTWEDIDYYKEREEPPTIAFTPDGCFPVTNSEKGILTLKYRKQLDASSLLEKIEVGESNNVVPGRAKSWIRKDSGSVSLHSTDNILIQEESDGSQVITAIGRSGPTSLPDIGSNAIDRLIKYLESVLPEGDSFWTAIHFYKKHLEDSNGKGHNLEIEDDVSGELTLAPCALHLKDKEVVFISNIRYPSTFSLEELTKRYQTTLDRSTFSHEIVEHKDPIYLDSELPFVQELMRIYNGYFKKDDHPLSISGGTYARAFPNTVAFGALIPGKPLNAHEADENIELSVIRDWINIYATTIYRFGIQGEGNEL